MVLLPDSEGRREPAREEAARRQRVRFARDVGDEAGLAWAHEPRRRRSRLTGGTALVLVAFALLGALPLLLRDGDGLVRPDCVRAAVGAGPSRVDAGGKFAWQAAGPDSGSYVVALDAREVTGPAAGPVQVVTGRVLAGPTVLNGCRSAQTVVTAPDQQGGHEIVLFRHAGSGWERAAVAALQVS